MIDKDMCQYKISQLKLMAKEEEEAEKRDEGYGAHLSHWRKGIKGITLDSEALKALITHYERRLEE